MRTMPSMENSGAGVCRGNYVGAHGISTELRMKISLGLRTAPSCGGKKPAVTTFCTRVGADEILFIWGLEEAGAGTNHPWCVFRSASLPHLNRLSPISTLSRLSPASTSRSIGRRRFRPALDRHARASGRIVRDLELVVVQLDDGGDDRQAESVPRCHASALAAIEAALHGFALGRGD